MCYASRRRSGVKGLLYNSSVDRGSASILVQVGCWVVMKVGWRGRLEEGCDLGTRVAK